MKFTKENAVEELTAKITAKDKDLDLTRTISESVDNALAIVGENDEMELSDFVKLVQPIVATACGLAHKTGSVATKTLQEKIADLEKQIATKKDAKDDKQKDEPSAEMKALLERLDKLEQQNAEHERLGKVAQKRKDISEAIEKLGVKDTEWVDAMLNEVTITEDTDVEQKSKDYVALYNKTHSSAEPSWTPKKSGGGDPDKIDLSGLDNALSQLRGNFGQNKQNV